MTLTITPTVDLTSTPPKVTLSVSDDSASPLTSITLQRVDPDGVKRQVRTTDGNALPLTGTPRTGTLTDFEPPYGQPVFYTSVESPSVTTATVTVDAAKVWLTHPGVPSLSRPISLRVGSHAEETRGVARGVFRPQGRHFPVIQTAGTRWAPSSSLIVAAHDLYDLADLMDLLDDAGTLLLNVPPSLGLGIDTAYISVDATKVRRLSTVGTDPTRDVELPYDVTDWPAGGTRGAWTMADIAANFATMAAIRDAFPTMADIAAGL